MDSAHKGRAPRRRPAFVTALLVLLLSVSCAGCSSLPRDADGWSDRVRQTRVLPVGVDHAGTVEPELIADEKRAVEAVAARLGARVEWREGNAVHLLDDLKEHRLPLVAAALPSDTPYSAEVGMSRPYRRKGPHSKDYCLAVAPGENALLLTVDRVAEEQAKGKEARR